jgi:hypothetical protein
MKTIIFALFIPALLAGCRQDDVKPYSKIEAEIGYPFTFSPPSEISFKETGAILYVDDISNYSDAGFASPIVTAKVRYNGSPFEIRYAIRCDAASCNPEIALDDSYSLQFEAILATTKVKDNDAGVDMYHIDTAQFVLKTH